MNKKIIGKMSMWLNSQGGRTMGDVLKDEKLKEYVLMWSGQNHTYVRIYLPSSEELLEMYPDKDEEKTT